MFKHNGFEFKNHEELVEASQKDDVRANVALLMITCYHNVIKWGMIGEYTDRGNNDPITFAQEWDLL